MTTRQQVFCKIYLKKIFNVYVIGVTKFTHNETWFIDKSNGNIVKPCDFIVSQINILFRMICRNLTDMLW